MDLLPPTGARQPYCGPVGKGKSLWTHGISSHKQDNRDRRVIGRRTESLEEFAQFGHCRSNVMKDLWRGRLSWILLKVDRSEDDGEPNAEEVVVLQVVKVV